MPHRQLTYAWFKRLNRVLLGSCILLIGLASAVANWDFGVIVQKAESRYGNLGQGKSRIQAWEAQIKASSTSSELDKLTEINRGETTAAGRFLTWIKRFELAELPEPLAWPRWWHLTGHEFLLRHA